MAQYKILYPLKREPGTREFLVEGPLGRHVLRMIDVADGEPDPIKLVRDLDLRRSLVHPQLARPHQLVWRNRRPGLLFDDEPLLNLQSLIRSPSAVGPILGVAARTLDLLCFLHCRGHVIGYLTPRQFVGSGPDDFRIHVDQLSAGQRPAPPARALPFCAPELLEAHPASEATDVFSVGTLLYGLFAPPNTHVGIGLSEMRSKQCATHRVSLRSLAPSLNGEFQELIDQMVCRAPRDRPTAATALSVIRELCNEEICAPDRLTAPLTGRSRELALAARLCREFQHSPECRILTVTGNRGAGRSRMLLSLADLAAGHRISTLSCRQHPDEEPSVSWQLLTATASGEDLSPVAWSGHENDMVQLVERASGLALNIPLLITIDIDRADAADRLTLMLSRAGVPAIIAVGKETELGLARKSPHPRSAEIRLHSLSIAQLETISEAALGQCPQAQPARCRSLTSLGQPGDWHEFVDHLRHRGDLRYKDGAWRLSGSTSLRAPSSVRESLARRIAALPPLSRRLLELLAVADQRAPFETLAEVLGVRRPLCERALQLLQDRELITVAGDIRKPRFKLAHSWLRQEAASAIAPDAQRALHRALAKSLIEHAEKDEQLAISIARHLAAAGEPAQQWVRRALVELHRQDRYRDACALVETSVAAGSCDPTEEGLGQQYIELMLQSGALSQCARAVNERLASALLRPRQRAHLYWLLGRMHLVRGERRKAIASFEHALEHAPRQALLQTELKSELLCLSALTSGESAGAPLASELRQKAQEAENPSDKLWHALFVNSYFGPRGNLPDALKCGTRTVEAACASGDPVRALGRISNLSHYLLALGSVQTGKRLSRYAVETAHRMGNAELIDFAESSEILCSRRLGEHSALARRLKRKEEANRRRSQNPHLAQEWKLERVKNLLHQSRLAEADQGLKELAATPTEHLPSVFEAGLLRGWWSLTVGRLETAFSIAEELKPPESHHFYGRALLLGACAQLDTDPEVSTRLALQGLECFGSLAPYYRSKALVILARALLRQERAPDALVRLAEARLLLDTGHHPPQVAEVLRCQASALRATNQLRFARAHCLRGLQIAREVQRPTLQSALLVELSRIEQRQGQRRIAAGHLEQGIGYIRRISDALSGDVRQSFVESRLNPLLVRSWSLFQGNREMPSDLLADLNAFSRLEMSSISAAKALIETVTKALPGAAVRVFLAHSATSRASLVASEGNFEVDGRDMLSEARRRPDEALLSRFGARHTVCGLPLRRAGELFGLVQVETNDEVIEAELDFLACLANLMTLRLPTFSSGRAARVSDGGAIRLSGGRVLVGESPQMVELFEQTRQVAKSKATVLLEGESGTGKELFARAFHELGPRRRRRLVAINCAAVPEELIENELFGNTAGSFTGARGKAGLVECAQGGTLFLDEVSSMPQAMQVRLLRVLQEKRVRRIGESTERAIDVRIVAATNRSLRQLVLERRFREDLFHRLNVFHLQIPPLRSRSEDVNPLCNQFLLELNRESGRAVRLSTDARRLLASYHFPGNVRELRNILESAFHTTSEDLITTASIASKLALPGALSSADERIETILDDLVSGRRCFWEAVREPFLDRDLSRSDVKQIVAIGLGRCDGSYRRLTEYFGLKPRDYKRFLNFLRDHRCRVDFRPYRRQKAVR